IPAWPGITESERAFIEWCCGLPESPQEITDGQYEQARAIERRAKEFLGRKKDILRICERIVTALGRIPQDGEQVELEDFVRIDLWQELDRLRVQIENVTDIDATLADYRRRLEELYSRVQLARRSEPQAQ